MTTTRTYDEQQARDRAEVRSINDRDEWCVVHIDGDYYVETVGWATMREHAWPSAAIIAVYRDGEEIGVR